MKKKLMLSISALLFIIAIIILAIGFWQNNNTKEIIAFVLIGVVTLINIIISMNR